MGFIFSLDWGLSFCKVNLFHCMEFDDWFDFYKWTESLNIKLKS